MKQTLKKSQIFFLFCLFILLGCAEGSSDLLPVSGMVAAPARPSGEAVVLSRELPFQNDLRISYCEVQSNKNSTYSGYRDQALYPLASLSKVMTTAWALNKLGPDFNFETKWYLRPISAGLYDAYLKTSYDPVFNIEKVLYSLAQLHAQGVLKIRNLVIDETTRVYLSALTQPHIELENVPVTSSESIQNLKRILNSENWAEQTAAAMNNLRSWSLAKSQVLQFPTTFSVDHIELKKSSEINLNIYPSFILVKSAPLFKYLKNMNVYSNNYISDALFSYLGSATEFNKFQYKDLKIAPEQLQLFTGSGLAVLLNGQRKDNQGSCLAVLKVFSFIDQLALDRGLNLGHFLYSPTSDKGGTFESHLNFSNQVVLKTGRLFENPAMNLAGVIATQKGSLFFTFLGHGFSDSEVIEIEKARDSLLTSALNFYPTVEKYQALNDFQILL